MRAHDILKEFEVSRTPPVAAMRAALVSKEEILPVFLDEIERALHMPRETLPYAHSYAIMFHILGQWADPRAYVPLTRFLRLDSDTLEELLGDTITETADCVIAAVATDDLTPIIDIILDREASLIIRSRMIIALLRIAITGPARRPAVVAFIEEFLARIEPDSDQDLLMDWAAAVAVLDLRHLEPLARDTIRRDSSGVSSYSISWFDDDLRWTERDPSGSWFLETQHEPGPINAIREISGWHCYSNVHTTGQDAEELTIHPALSWADQQIGHIHFGKVGRIDPCPCGSGKNYENCCQT